jgi:glycosyltransferase involved in cell wall biosynthesis
MAEDSKIKRLRQDASRKPFISGIRTPEFYLFAYWHDPRWRKFVGATVKVWDLAHNLSSCGQQVVLFLPKYRFKRDGIPFRLVEIPFVNMPFFRIVSFNICLAIVLFVRFFSERPETIYSRRMTSIIPLLFAKAVGARFYYEVNDDPFALIRSQGSRFAFFIRSWLSRRIDAINLKACQKAFVISEGVKTKIMKNLTNIESAKLIILPSGANIDLFRPLPMDQCRTRLGLQLSKKYILFVGTLLEHQGIDMLIEAAARVILQVPGSQFLILGEGPSKYGWTETIYLKGLSDHFIFTGQIAYENVATWIGAADICVAPFKKSSGLRSPVKIFDYLACAKAVVASKMLGTTDIFEKSGAVMLITPEDPNALANAIIGLLRDETKALGMGQKGREFIFPRYDRKQLTRQVINASIACDTQN